MDDPRTERLEQLRDVFRLHLYLPDISAVDFSVAVAVANRMPGDPLWGMVVGASGGGKTEAVESVGGLPEARPISAMTSRTLLSGRGPNFSLLLKMKNAGQSLMVLKDFGTIISTRHDERAELLQQLREVFDGRFSRDVGSGSSLTWTGRMGFLAGSTPAIDQHAAVLGVLGERWVYLRLPDVEDDPIAGAAFDQDDEEAMRAVFRDSVTKFVEDLDLTPPDPTSVREEIKRMAIRTAWIRTAVQRDGYSREIVERPVREKPTRLTKQLRRLWQAAVVMGHPEPLRFVDRVARDSAKPMERREVLNLLARNGPTAAETIRTRTNMPYIVGKRVIEDLETLGLIVRAGTGPSSGGRPPLLYDIAPNLRALSVPRRTNDPPPALSVPRTTKSEGNEE